MKKDTNHKNFWDQDCWGRDKTIKQTKSRVEGRKGLGMESREKGLPVLLENPVLDPSL